MKAIRVGLMQMDSQDQKERNMRRASELLEEAVSRGATLVGLPEYFNFIGEENQESEQAETIPGPTTTQMAEWARKHHIWLHGGSLLERVDGRDKLFNTTVVFSPDGKIVSRYRKIHLFDVDVMGGPAVQESTIREPGDQIVVCPTPVGTIGLSICYDLRFCEVYRILALKGAQVVFVPSMFADLTGRDHWEPLLKARAIENQFFVLAPAQIGKKPLYSCYGHSIIVDPWGTVLAQAPDGETSLLADLDLEKIEVIRKQIPCLKNRRPSAYRWP
ncbi:MAG: carbon-nitrogen hydrolase family protein [Proteobacteria bacterium]|nr:carbon-nitrogen hydrolase family protein [Pseudomonadota bacterium]NIS72161.1 carbon-nitrogen hydrolase family protein [Pseudomonadota bacterium]